MAGKTATGWDKINSFFEGLSGVTDQIGGIVDTGANIAEDIARGKAAIADEQLDKEERRQAMFLDKLKVTRQDNVQLYWALAFVGVLGVVLVIK